MNLMDITYLLVFKKPYYCQSPRIQELQVHFLAACSILICHAITELSTVLEGREKPQGLRELTCAFRGKLARNAA